jgi:cystathionine beta-lyase
MIALPRAEEPYSGPMSTPPHMKRLRALTGAKWAYHDDHIIPAWVADMDFPTAPEITSALRRLVDNADTGYNAVSFDKSVVEAWAQWSQRRHGWRPDPESSRLHSSTLQPIAAAVHAATEPGDGVALFTPIYPPFLGLIENAGRRIDEYRLDETEWRIDSAVLESVVSESTRAVLLCNPHNPTGRVFDTEELSAVAEIAQARDAIVISDEIWSDIVYPGAAHIPFATLGEDAAARTVTTTSASKSFNLGGLSCAVAHYGSEGLLEAVRALPPHLLGGVNVMGAVAAIEAWTRGDAWFDETLSVLEANRDHLMARLAEELSQVEAECPEATYLAWLDLRATGLGDDPAEKILERANVALSAGPEFGTPGAGFARLNFATPVEVLDEILDRIVSAV